MVNAFSCLLKKKVTETRPLPDDEIERIGKEIRQEIDARFGRSLAIRELDAGSDNAAEIEINNLSNAFYDVERFGITFVASPRHADVLIVTGAVTHNMEIAVQENLRCDALPEICGGGRGRCLRWRDLYRDVCSAWRGGQNFTGGYEDPRQSPHPHADPYRAACPHAGGR